MIGQTVSHYTILDRLGGGGMGVVYSARDLRLDRVVALKFLPPDLTRDPDAKQRFVQEAKAASALQHNNICTIHDIDETADGRLFIVMDFYDGETVKKRIERGPMPLEEALRIALQTALGLARAHELRMIHRDIKPANVLVTADGETKIVDFGLARLAGATRLTREGSTVGTPAYMSPEQLRGEDADARTDLWSLGVMLYEMVSGVLPFRGEHESAIAYCIQNTEPPPLTSLRAGLPLELDHIVAKTLAKLPGERYQHADELAADLRHLLRETDRGPPASGAAPSRPPRPRNTVHRIVISGVLIAIAAAAVLIFRPFLSEETLIGEPRPIAVISFVNQTGDPGFDYLQDAIPNLLITNLERSRYLRVTTWERMRDLLKQMGKTDVTVIDRELGFEVCEKDGINAIVLGSFVKAGNVFATDVKVLDVRTKQLLNSASTRGEGVESILRAQIDQLSLDISRSVGVPERPLQAFPTPIAQQTTPSMDAYTYYLRGQDEYDKFYFTDAKRFFLRAVEIDTGFASAYARLGMAEQQLGNLDEAAKAFEQARHHVDRSTIKSRMKINGITAWYLEHDGPKAMSILQELVRLYPDEKEAYYFIGRFESAFGTDAGAVHNLTRAIELDPSYAEALNMLAYVHSRRGRYAEAIECLQKYALVQPGHANPFDSMGELYYRMGRLDDAAAKYLEALEVRPDFFPSMAALMYIRSLKRQPEEARRLLDDLHRVAGSEGWSAEANCLDALFCTAGGELKRGSRLLRQARDGAGVAGNAPLVSACEWIEGWSAYDRADYAGAMRWFRRSLMNALKGDSSHWAEAVSRFCYAAGRTDLMRGRIDSAAVRMALLRDLPAAQSAGRQAAVDHCREMLHAHVLLARDSTAEAVTVLRGLPPLDIPNFATVPYVYYTIPFDRDALARALEQQGDISGAVAECERITRFDASGPDRRLDHPRYHYLLGTLYERLGDWAKAAAAFRECVEVWKGADPDYLEHAAARQRLASLLRTPIR